MIFQVLTCLTQEHDPGIVFVAGIICLVASFVTMTMLKRGQRVSGSVRWVWLATAGAFGGFGIWSTHFIAMLAYGRNVIVGYDISSTFVSLAIAIGATWAAVTSTAVWEGRTGNVLGGMFFGLGIASMHFTGMSAIEFPGQITWDANLVWASVLLGTSLSVFAFYLARRESRRRAPAVGSAFMMATSVFVMHFTAMAAVMVVPGVVAVDASTLLSQNVMVVLIGVIALSLLSSGFSAAIFATRADRKALASERNLNLLVRSVKDYAIYMIDLDGRISNWNSGAERAMGYSAEEVMGQDFLMFRPAEEREEGLVEQVLETARTEGKYTTQGWRQRKDGSAIWVSSVIEAIHDEDGKLVGYATITKDITQHKLDADRLAEASQRILDANRNITAVSRNLDIALENMTQAICLYDKDERLVIANQHYSELFRFPDGLVRPGMTYREIVEQGFLANIKNPELARQKAREHYELNIALVRAGGGKNVATYSSGKSVQNICHTLPDGGWVVTFEDITERLRTEEHINYMASHDVLTGLPNRVQFNAYLVEEAMIAERTGTRLAVISIDLDKFKEINDQHGHPIGDMVLIELARRMGGALQGEELVARFGGDEFAAVKRFDDMAELHDFVDRIEKCLFGRIDAHGLEIRTGASLGIALYPQDADTLEALVANAEMAMYRAKQSLVQRVCYYEVAMDEAARDRRGLVKDLWSAIEHRQLHLHYQVQKSVLTGLTTGYEVLLRWRHPIKGNIPPMDFIPLAEECGAIMPIGEWVLREACQEAAKWHQPYKIAVNLSPVQLGHADMAAVVLKVLAETGLDPKRLEIEITESAFITEKSRALLTLRQIKNLGVSIAIDDFGTGYSSLETLRAFPFDKIKLDKSFMNEVETSHQAKAIIRAILTLGQSLDVPVLAEGVETQAQMEILLEEKCDEAQGYFLGRPVPLDEMLSNVGREARFPAANVGRSAG